MVSLGARVKALRIHTFGEGYGAKRKMAESLRIPPSTYANYEADGENRTPKKLPGHVVEGLVAVTGVNRRWLLLGEGEMLGLPNPPAVHESTALYRADPILSMLASISTRLADLEREIKDLREQCRPPQSG